MPLSSPLTLVLKVPLQIQANSASLNSHIPPIPTVKSSSTLPTSKMISLSSSKKKTSAKTDSSKSASSWQAKPTKVFLEQTWKTTWKVLTIFNFHVYFQVI